MSAPTQPQASSIIDLEDVGKTYGSLDVVKGVNINVAPAERFALIGPSGSGKTTLMRMMVGQSVPTAGKVLVGGAEPHRFTSREKKRVGYVPQHFLLYPSLSVEQNARFAAGIYGIGWLQRRSRIRETLTRLDLWEARSRAAKDISGGMQRRLAFACALLHKPELLFVDEPTAGLDPLLREVIWDYLTSLQDEGVTVVLNTQYLDEAERSDRVGLMNRGELIALGTPADLRAKALGGEAIDISANPLTWEHAQRLMAMPGVRRVGRIDWSSGRVIVDNAEEMRPRIEEELREAGADVESVETHVPTFDDVFRMLIEEGRERELAS